MRSSVYPFLVVSALSVLTVDAFSTTPSSRIVGKMLITRQMTSSVDDFAAPTPSPLTSVSAESGELEIDLDSLASESAAETKAFTPKIDISSMYANEESRKAPRQAQWFPMLLSPASLDGAYAGDVGFDPLGFAKDKASLVRMREAEIKHARLAMLAAAGWPLSELWHRDFAKALSLDSILVADKAPSILNGGLSNEWVIGTGVAFLVVATALEFLSFQMAQKEGYKPGDYGFDPLGLYPLRASFGLDRIDEQLSREEKIARGRFDMELCEIKNGRLAMLAITADAAQEFISGIPVVQQTPFFFGDPIV